MGTDEAKVKYCYVLWRMLDGGFKSKFKKEKGIKVYNCCTCAVNALPANQSAILYVCLS